MNSHLLTSLERDKLNRLLQELAVAGDRLGAAINTPDFAKADAAVGALRERIREVQGLPSWMVA